MRDRRPTLDVVIDDRPLKAFEGETVLQVARRAGIEIPTLCHLDGLTPWGACRLCVVEIAEQRGLPPACATTVVDDMEVRTDTPRLRSHRRMIVEMLFAEGNHVCSVCVANEHCELQRVAASVGVDHVRLTYQAPRRAVDASHPRYVFDPNRCILCTRCVRTCDEIEGAHVWDIAHRGEHAQLISGLGGPWGTSRSCTQCGKCVAACPTGALFSQHAAMGEARHSPGLIARLVSARHRHEWLPPVETAEGEEVTPSADALMDLIANGNGNGHANGNGNGAAPDVAALTASALEWSGTVSGHARRATTDGRTATGSTRTDGTGDGAATTGTTASGQSRTRPGPIRVATAWLGGCSGCHMSLLDLDEALIDLAARIDLVYGPLVDAKEFPADVDVAIIEGAVANEENLELAQQVRERSRLVVSLGDCAVSGNVTAMRNPLGDPQALLQRVYVDHVTRDGVVPDQVVPKLLPRVLPLHQVIRVDAYLPGCPPPAQRIGSVLTALLDDLEGRSGNGAGQVRAVPAHQGSDHV